MQEDRTVTSRQTSERTERNRFVRTLPDGGAHLDNIATSYGHDHRGSGSVQSKCMAEEPARDLMGYATSLAIGYVASTSLFKMFFPAQSGI